MGGNGNLEPICALHTSHTQNCEQNARDRPLAEIFTSGKPLERERERERERETWVSGNYFLCGLG